MFKKRCLRIGMILLVFIVMVAISTNTYGAINENYYNDIVEDLNVIDGALDSKVKGSVLLDAIAVLVYVVGSLMEWILGGIFQAISGGAKVFPWADAILFNAVPLLDINVFNPSGASLAGIMQEFIASSYWTIFYLALSFMGIAIMITAIKLAISTIASDKAQYKQAIVKWIMGFIMLWGIHFFMSFVLYLNEGLVEYASELAKNATQESSVDLAKLRDTSQSDYDTVQNFIEVMTNNTRWNWETIAGATVAIVAIGLAIWFAWPAIVAVKAGATFATVTAMIGKCATTLAVVGASGFLLADGVQLSRDEFLSIYGTTIKAVRENEKEIFKDKGIDETVKYLMGKDNVQVAARLLRNDDYVNSLQAQLKTGLRGDSSATTWNENGVVAAVYYLAADVNLVLRDTYDVKIKDSVGTELGSVSGDAYKDLLNGYLINTNSNNLPIDERVIRDYDETKWNSYKITSNDPEVEAIEENVNYDEMVLWYCKAMTYAREDYEDRQSGGNGKQDKSNIISTLAKAFKEMAWTNTSTSWKPSKPVIQGALLYAILVAQSLIFFISYAKRLFYVLILILVAPVIVVYDFFTRFSS